MSESSSSSDSSAPGDGADREGFAEVRTSPEVTPGEEEASEGSSSGDPGSPIDGRQGSEASCGGGSSSDGVLVDPASSSDVGAGSGAENEQITIVDLPGRADQVEGADQDGGILVNFDGSMQDQLGEEGQIEDSGRDDMFVDAPEQLTFVDARSVDLGESVALVDAQESAPEFNIHARLTGEIEQLRAQLNEAVAEKELAARECKEYKEERETFSRDVSNLHHTIQSMIHRQPIIDDSNDELRQHLGTTGQEEVDTESLASCALPLHVMLNNCSDILSNFKAEMGNQLHSESTIKELHEVIFAKDQELEDLNSRISEISVSHDVVISYVASFREGLGDSMKEASDIQHQGDAHLDIVTKRLLDSLAAVVEQEDTSAVPFTERIFIAEKSISILIERYKQFLSKISQLGECLAEICSDYTTPQENELIHVSSKACEVLFECKNKESDFVHKINQLEEENKKLLAQLEHANGEIERISVELVQGETKVTTYREKLSLAVTKGKGLVQQRDSLKQSLNEKTIELEKCLAELQQKSHALEVAEAGAQELIKSQNLVVSLQDTLLQRDEILQEIGEAVSQIDMPEELQSMEAVDKIRWLVDQINVSKNVSLESQKIKEAMSSIQLPETISSDEIESQINWLGRSFSQAQDDLSKLKDEVTDTQAVIASRELEISEAHQEIERLSESLLSEKQAEDSLQMELKGLKSKYEGLIESMSKVSSEKDVLMRALVDASESTMDDHTQTEMFIENCVGKIRAKIHSSMESYDTMTEHIQKLQILLYVRDQDRILYEEMLEEEMLNKPEMMSMAEKLKRALEELMALNSERDSLQKDLERAEEKCSLIREKLSMAVKKGKGLVQEKEGFKHSLDEKNSEIQKLKLELQIQESAVNEYKEQIKNLSAELERIQKLESDIVAVKEQRDQVERFLLERNTTLERMIESIETLSLPTDIRVEDPIERVNWVAEHVQQLRATKLHVEEDLDKAKEEILLQASRLEDAFATIKSMENLLSQAEKDISLISKEKHDAQAGMSNAKQELVKLKEEAVHAFATRKMLEDQLSEVENNFSVLMEEKKEVERRSNQEIITLNARLAACMDELAGNQNHSLEFVGHLKNLEALLNDQGLLSSLVEGFKQKFEGLRNMGLLLQDIHDQFAEKAQHNHFQQDLAKLASILQHEDYLSGLLDITGTETMELSDNISSFAQVIEGFSTKNKVLADKFEGLSSYLDGHVELLLRAMQTLKDDVFQVIGLGESLKTSTDNLEVRCQAQDVQISKLQSNLNVLLSACTTAVQELQFDDQNNMPDSNIYAELGNLTTRGSAGGGLDQEGERLGLDEYAHAAENLLLAAKRGRNHTLQYENSKSGWETALNDLQSKLEETELAAENVLRERNLNQERISKLEGDLETLQTLCNEMKLGLDDYYAKEDHWKKREAELSSLHHALAANDTGADEWAFLKENMEALIDKVNKFEIPMKKSEAESRESQISSPLDKLLYIIANFSGLQQQIDSLSHHNEELETDISVQAREIENLKNIAESFDRSNQDIENKILAELTSGLERIVQMFGERDVLKDKKHAGAMGLVSTLERLVHALVVESDSSKSKTQEFGVKLQASQKVVDELSDKVKLLEDSIESFHAKAPIPDPLKERSIFEASSSSAMGSDISEIEEVGPLGKNIVPTIPAAAHSRTMRKGSGDHLAININTETERLISSHETDDKGHVFKSLNTSGLVPKQGKSVADKIDSIWVSGGRMLMSRPEARMGLIAYWVLLHIWLLGTLL
ncbi:hypothetical protein QJS10_CPA06g01308 [Acorus calamus]|uniref:Uncharacterized protein n=1 Tax=Acorus calamus TaxID=4465 RepID=A0AAV9ERM1_ACOCL|nr:hypothetical protein QJS10_CPA06g01308 [Acorus calamus]